MNRLINTYTFLLGGGELADELRKEIQSLRIRVEQLETEMETKNSEIKILSSCNKASEIQVGLSTYYALNNM